MNETISELLRGVFHCKRLKLSVIKDTQTFLFITKKTGKFIARKISNFYVLIANNIQVNFDMFSYQYFGFEWLEDAKKEKEYYSYFFGHQ